MEPDRSSQPRFNFSYSSSSFSEKPQSFLLKPPSRQPDFDVMSTDSLGIYKSKYDGDEISTEPDSTFNFGNTQVFIEDTKPQVRVFIDSYPKEHLHVFMEKFFFFKLQIMISRVEVFEEIERSALVVRVRGEKKSSIKSKIKKMFLPHLEELCQNKELPLVRLEKKPLYKYLSNVKQFWRDLCFFNFAQQQLSEQEIDLKADPRLKVLQIQKGYFLVQGQQHLSKEYNIDGKFLSHFFEVAQTSNESQNICNFMTEIQQFKDYFHVYNHTLYDSEVHYIQGMKIFTVIKMLKSAIQNDIQGQFVDQRDLPFFEKEDLGDQNQGQITGQLQELKQYMKTSVEQTQRDKMMLLNQIRLLKQKDRQRSIQIREQIKRQHQAKIQLKEDLYRNLHQHIRQQEQEQMALRQVINKLMKDFNGLCVLVSSTSIITKKISEVKDQEYREYLDVLHRMLIHHFFCYSVASEGFFTNQNRYFNNTQQAIEGIQNFSPMGMLVSKVSSFLNIPSTVYNFYQSSKTYAKNAAVALRINASRLRDQMQAHAAVAYVIDKLIKNEKFRARLKVAIQNLKNDAFFRAKKQGWKLYKWCNQTAFQVSQLNFSIMEELAGSHMISIAHDFALRDIQEFKICCAENQSFYQLILSIIEESFDEIPALPGTTGVRRLGEGVKAKVPHPRATKLSLRDRSRRNMSIQ